MAENLGTPLKRTSTSLDQGGYTFAHSNRFKKESPTPGFYSIPNVLKRQGTKFGSEKRPEVFIKPSLSPGPGYYSPSHLKPALGRVISDSNIGCRLIPAKKISPGPGDYSISRDLIGPKYTMKGRYKSKDPEITPSGSNYNPIFSGTFAKKFSQTGFGEWEKVDTRKRKISPGERRNFAPISFPKIANAGMITRQANKKRLSGTEEKLFGSSSLNKLLKN